MFLNVNKNEEEEVVTSKYVCEIKILILCVHFENIKIQFNSIKFELTYKMQPNIYSVTI